jgi:hypothetical protein
MVRNANPGKSMSSFYKIVRNANPGKSIGLRFPTILKK